MSTKNAIDALIADSQPLTVAGLETFLSVKQGIKIVGKVSKGGDLIDLMEKLQPALLIVEYNIPGYISVDDIRNAMLTSTKTNVLILSSDNNKATILEALQLGVKGYITKECSLEEVGMRFNQRRAERNSFAIRSSISLWKNILV
jgi:DNA-binding NarL/FixJ family response regulator